MKVGYEWSPEFFEMMYEAMVRRKAVEELSTRKIMTISTMTAAFYSNPNYDSKDGQTARGDVLRELNETIDESFRETVAKIYGAEIADIDEIDMNDPWWAAMNVPQMQVVAEAAKEESKTDGK